MSQLGQMYQKIAQHRPTMTPHTAAAEEISGKFYGLVRHGSASSTTLPDAFDDAEKAKKHAQLVADGLNKADEHAANHASDQ